MNTRSISDSNRAGHHVKLPFAVIARYNHCDCGERNTTLSWRKKNSKVLRVRDY